MQKFLCLILLLIYCEKKILLNNLLNSANNSKRTSCLQTIGLVAGLCEPGGITVMHAKLHEQAGVLMCVQSDGCCGSAPPECRTLTPPPPTILPQDFPAFRGVFFPVAGIFITQATQANFIGYSIQLVHGS
jgi:hypothetical protein